MCKHLLLAAAFALLGSSSALAQVVVTSRPVVTTHYAPAAVRAPVVTYYSPVVSAPAPAVTYSAPVTTYYAPAPVTAYYAPVTTYYGGPVVAPVVVGSPVVAGRSAYGTLRAYVPGQPVRNTLRFLTP